MKLSAGKQAGAVLGALLAIWAAMYAGSLRSIVHVWETNATFSHGYLIVPIALWLAWRKRRELAQTAIEPSWVGVLVLVVCALLWVAGRGVGVLAVEQFAAVAMVPAIVIAVLGMRVAAVMTMPLLYLLLAVPIGSALVPWLMQITADVATGMLKLSGVPIHRSAMYISIPSGKFEVARACSGLNYAVTGVALGILYSYVTYVDLRKRLLAVAAFCIVPVVANGLRVYFTILTSHLTTMRFGPGEEHVWFGRAFFILVVCAMFWVGRRWRDEAPASAVSRAGQMQQPVLGMQLLPMFAAAAVLFLAPANLTNAVERLDRQLSVDSSRLRLMTGQSTWRGPIDGAAGWKPLYDGARVERTGVYQQRGGATVDVYVGVYGLGTSGGGEMISYSNRISTEEHLSLRNSEPRYIDAPGGRRINVREERIAAGRRERLVWYWFTVGERSTTNRYTVKALEALSFLTQAASTERVVTLSTVADGDEAERLADFARLHAECLVTSFAGEDCNR